MSKNEYKKGKEWIKEWLLCITNKQTCIVMLNSPENDQTSFGHFLTRCYIQSEWVSISGNSVLICVSAEKLKSGASTDDKANSCPGTPTKFKAMRKEAISEVS